MSLIIDLQKITKAYHLGDMPLPVLKGIDFSIEKGEMVSIVGASGSGKSTLMNIIGLLDRHDEGKYYLNGTEVKKYTDDDLAKIRNQTIGFVFQQFFLLPRLTALQNVALPLLYRGIRGKKADIKCLEILDRVGMTDYVKHRPSELSGGQQQRVAIARALVSEPSVVLADEPTGALDSQIGQEVMDLFKELNREDEVTIIVITHDHGIAAQCQRIVRVKDGLVIDKVEEGSP